MRLTALYDITPWNNFHSPIVKDLAWMLFACDLINHTPLYEKNRPFRLFKHCDYPKVHYWLNQLEANIKAGQKPLLQRENFKRLGLYCEALFEVLTTKGYDAGITPYRLLKRNIQVNKDRTKITLGELDFLVQGENEEVIHVEMAIKYYLLSDHNDKTAVALTPSIPNYAHKCIGPNRADRLDLKLNRLLTHQLPLINKSETQQALLDQNIATVNIQKPSSLYLKGQIYTYYQNRLAPANINLRRPTLIWSHINRALHAMRLCEQQYKHKNTLYRWVILEKLDWLASPTIQANEINKTLTKQQLANALIDKNTITFKPPVLIELLLFTDSTCTHKSRVMLVKNSWPAQL